MIASATSRNESSSQSHNAPASLVLAIEKIAESVRNPLI